MARRSAPETLPLLDTELADLPPDLRWREWMGRVEAAIFASGAPVPPVPWRGSWGRRVCSTISSPISATS